MNMYPSINRIRKETFLLFYDSDPDSYRILINGNYEELYSD